MIPETPTEVRAVLRQRGIRPRKSRGQNFLADRNVRDAIVRAAGIEDGDLVLEVGPGLGILTRGLLEAGAEVVAVELDGSLARFLEAEFAGEPRLEVLVGDALEKGCISPMVSAALGRRQRDGRRLLVANLPYSAGSAVLAAEARSERHPDRSVVMLQREVALRLTATPGGSDYGPLAVLHALRGTARIVREVAGGVFVPSTSVRSAVVEFVPKPVDRRDLLAGERAARGSFLHRRKTIRRSLILEGIGADRVSKALSELGIDPDRRPETISPEEFVALGRDLFDSTA